MTPEPDPENVLTPEEVEGMAQKIAQYYLDLGRDLHLWQFGIKTKETRWSKGRFETVRVTVEIESYHDRRYNEQQANIQKIKDLEEEIKNLKIQTGELAIALMRKGRL